MFGTSVSFGIMLVLSFSLVVTFCESIGQAIIMDCLFGFSSIHSTFNIPFLIFPRVEDKSVYLLESVIFSSYSLPVFSQLRGISGAHCVPQRPSGS